MIYVNTCCASFPTDLEFYSDTLQTQKIKRHHYNLIRIGADLSLCKCISCRNGIDPISEKPHHLLLKSDNIIENDKRETGYFSYVFLSVLSALGSLLFGLLSLGNGFSHTGSDSAVSVFFILSIISFVSAIILAIKAKNKGAKWGAVMLGLAASIVVAIFLFPLFFV